MNASSSHDSSLRLDDCRTVLLMICSTSLECKTPHAEVLTCWAKSMNLQQIVALRPEAGSLADSMPVLRATLAGQSICLVLVDRPEDLRLRPLATGGFFQFWEHVRRSRITPAPQNP